MRSKLLISTAALLASVTLASAQNVPGGRESGAQSQGAPGAAAEHERQSPQNNELQRGKNKQGQAQQEKGKIQRGENAQKNQTTGQAPQQEQNKAQPHRSQRNDGQTTGQGTREQNQSPSQTQRDQSQGQAPQRQQSQQGQTGPAPQGQAEQGRSAGGNVTLTTEQRTKIRQTVLAGGNVPRASNVNFSVSVGTVVPTTVRVVAVPSVIVDIHPEWRGYMYFVVDDEIIIVDSGHRIVAVLAV